MNDVPNLARDADGLLYSPGVRAALGGFTLGDDTGVLETAAAHGYRRLVLGAWGCGVFQNEPAQVAAAFRALLGPGGRFARTFEHITFGILDRTTDQKVLESFERGLRTLARAPQTGGGVGGSQK